MEWLLWGQMGTILLCTLLRVLVFPPLVSESPTPHRSLAKGQSLGREVVRGRRHPDLSCDQHHVARVVLSKH